MKPLRLLITNDDGIHAPGMDAMCSALRGQADVTVVAPTEERSACGHGITLKHPLRIATVEKDDGIERYAINGTPADCVKMALHQIFVEPPDLVISGINLGPNLGINVIYSGTVAGAVEAAIQGVPAVAVSLTIFQEPHFGASIKMVESLCDVVSRVEMDYSSMLLNVNLPNIALEQVNDICPTTQGVSRFIEDFDRRQDTYGRTYYWMAGGKEAFIGPDHSDEKCIQLGSISITPLHFDLTDYCCLPHDSDPKQPFELSSFIDHLKESFFS